MRRGTGILNKAPVKTETLVPPLREFMCEGRHYRIIEASYSDLSENGFKLRVMNLNEKTITEAWYHRKTGKIGNEPRPDTFSAKPPRYIDPAQVLEVIEWDFK